MLLRRAQMPQREALGEIIESLIRFFPGSADEYPRLSPVGGWVGVVGLAYLGMWGFLLVVQDGWRRIRLNR
jgi:hypothetical protein